MHFPITGACDKPSGVKINGSFEGKHGSKINFTCSTGFKGDAECKNGTWWMDCKPGITCFPSHVKGKLLSSQPRRVFIKSGYPYVRKWLNVIF